MIDTELIDILQRTFLRAHTTLQVAVEAYNYELQLSLVARNRGLSLVPARILHRSRLRSRLRVLRIPDLGFHLTIWMVRGPLTGSLEAVVAALSRELGQRLSGTRRGRRQSRRSTPSAGDLAFRRPADTRPA